MEKEKLNEAPTQFTIPRDLLNDPDRLDVGAIAKNADQEAKEKARMAELEAKAQEVLTKIKEDERFKDGSDYDKLECIFENTVPASGKSATVAGEIARAMMRLLYRDYNDGDKFYEGYGLETCAPSMSYLIDNISEAEDMAFDMMKAAGEYDYDDEDYTNDLNQLGSIILDYLMSNPELFGEENTDDSRSYEVSMVIEDNKPTYEYEPDTSNHDLDFLLRKGFLSDSDVRQAVDDIAYDLCGSQYEVNRIYGDSYVITGIDHESLENLEQDFDRFFEQWVDSEYDRYQEEQDELDDIDDEEDEDDDDFDESLQEEFDPDDITMLEE